MDRFRFLHAADIHLDSPLQKLERYEGAPVAEIRLASRRALENLVAAAIEQQVKFVLIAGDLYDGDWKDHHTGLFFVSQMAQLREAGIPVFVIKGNHDAANRMTLQLSLPENVHMLDHRKPQTELLDDLGVAIHGQSFAKRDVEDDLSQAYPAAIPGLLNIGLLHTCASGREGHAAYAPCTVEGLRGKNYDYWALGHIHKPEVLCSDPYIIFPGNLQGRHIHESGAKGCIVVDVADGRIVGTAAQPLDVFRWERCWVDASGAQTTADLLERIQQAIKPLVAGAGERSLAVRVELAGACKAHREIAARSEQWIAEVRAVAFDLGHPVWIEKVQTATTLPVDLASAAALDGPLGELARYIEELKSDPEQITGLLGDNLAELRKKLPGDVPLAGFAASGELLDQVQQMLIERLSTAATSEVNA